MGIFQEYRRSPWNICQRYLIYSTVYIRGTLNDFQNIFVAYSMYHLNTFMTDSTYSRIYLWHIQLIPKYIWHIQTFTIDEHIRLGKVYIFTYRCIWDYINLIKLQLGSQSLASSRADCLVLINIPSTTMAIIPPSNMIPSTPAQNY